MYGEFLNILNNWQPEVQLSVKVRFIKRGTNAPLQSNKFTVRLYEKDIFSDDDYLGHAPLNENGEAVISFFPSDISNFSNGFDQLPDLYLLLFDGNVVHFQTKVWDNVSFEKVATLDINKGELLDFGTFLVD